MSTEERQCEDTERRQPSAGCGERPREKPSASTLVWTSSLQSAEQINFCCFSFLVAVGVLASQYTHRFQAWKQWTPPPTNKDTQTRFLRAHCRQGVRIISTAEGESLLVESREGIRCAPTGSCCHGEAGGRLTRSRASPVLG